MSKFPLLEQMRAQRQRREDEVTAPYKAELRQAASMIAVLRQKVRSMEEFFGREIAKHVMGEIGHKISGRLMELVYKAAAVARREEAKPIHVMLPPDLLRFMDPGSIERDILRRYGDENLPRLSLRLDTSPMDSVTTVDIRVPELGFRQALLSRNRA